MFRLGKLGCVVTRLGSSPKSIPLVLTRDSGFRCVLRRKGGEPWPVAAVVTIVVAGETWAATVVDDEIRWSVDESAVQAVVGADPSSYKLRYEEPPDFPAITWATGPVEVAA